MGAVGGIEKSGDVNLISAEKVMVKRGGYL